jgi:hypothetical protein
MTISSIEQQINAWVLDNSSDVAMYKSLTALIDLQRR